MIKEGQITIDPAVSYTLSFHTSRLYQMESNFNMSNSYFILAETLIIIAYVTSLASTVHAIIFNLLYTGLAFSFLWILINIQYFIRYLERHNTLAREFTALTHADQRAWRTMTFWEKWKTDMSFWTFLITPVTFIAIYGILLSN